MKTTPRVWQPHSKATMSQSTWHDWVGPPISKCIQFPRKCVKYPSGRKKGGVALDLMHWPDLSLLKTTNDPPFVIIATQLKCVFKIWKIACQHAASSRYIQGPKRKLRIANVGSNHCIAMGCCLDIWNIANIHLVVQFVMWSAVSFCTHSEMVGDEARWVKWWEMRQDEVCGAHVVLASRLPPRFAFNSLLAAQILRSLRSRVWVCPS